MMYFNSPTYGKLHITQVVRQILRYISANPEDIYRVVIGTDSQPKNSYRYDFVSAIVIHCVGSGGIYFWQRIVKNKKYVLRDRMYEEAIMSLHLAENLMRRLSHDELHEYEIEIHVDIGKGGETRDMISEIVGMVRGHGYQVRTKPEAYGAACVADRYA